MTNLDDVPARIRRLERTVLGLLLLALAALLIAGAAWRALWAERSPGPALDTIRAGSVETGELVLRDRDGNVASMLKRYDIISLDDLRQAARRGSEYAGQPSQVSPLRRKNP
jgi:hypothetical protein